MVKKKGSRDINPADAYRKEQVEHPHPSLRFILVLIALLCVIARVEKQTTYVLSCSEQRRSRETRKRGSFSEMPIR